MLLLPLFADPMVTTIREAMDIDLDFDARTWPTKDGSPAVASKRAQTLTYDIEHFLVSCLKLRIREAAHFWRRVPTAVSPKIFIPFLDPSASALIK